VYLCTGVISFGSHQLFAVSSRFAACNLNVCDQAKIMDKDAKAFASKPVMLFCSLDSQDVVATYHTLTDLSVGLAMAIGCVIEELLRMYPGAQPG
jgi:hypothetical protein